MAPCAPEAITRLPWAMALPSLKRNPAPIRPILEALRDDESEYVRRSVADNLNDISKDQPESGSCLAAVSPLRRPRPAVSGGLCAHFARRP